MDDRDKNNQSWIQIRRVGAEKEIKLFVVVEFLRLLLYAWFLLIVVVGTTLTRLCVEEDYKKTVTSIFGALNICAMFDFPPSTYVLPSMYAVLLIFVYHYSVASIVRAWIAKEEGKMSGAAFILYSCTFIYFSLSAAIFSTIFAVQPNPNEPKTILIHTLPFTNLIIALTSLQIAVTWFGISISWMHLNTPTYLRFGSIVCVGGLVVTSIFKVLQQINSLGDLGVGNQGVATGKGMWYNVSDDTLGVVHQVVDASWMMFAFVGPMFQSLYITCKKFDTHGVIITFGDNRKAKDTENNYQTKLLLGGKHDTI